MTIDDIRNKYTLKVANGSGVLVIAENGEYAYIFTAYHVVKEKSKEDLTFSFQDTAFNHFHPINLVKDLKYYDEKLDIAIIVVENNFTEIENIHIRTLNEYKGTYYHVGYPECRTDSTRLQNITHNIKRIDGGNKDFIECEYSKPVKDSEIIGTSGGGIFEGEHHELVGVHIERSNVSKKEFLGKTIFSPIQNFVNLLLKNGLPLPLINIESVIEQINRINNAKQMTDYLREKALNSVKRLSVIRTFLYWNEDRSFEDIYYPLSLNKGTYPISDKSELMSSITIKDNVRFFRDKGKSLSIIGNAGSGKSMLMKHIYLLAVKAPDIVPIMVVLRYMRERTLMEYLSELLFTSKEKVEFVDLAFSTGNLLIIFDGFDELTKDRREILIGEIDRLSSNYPDNRYVLTSRPNAGAENIPNFQVYSVNPLLEDDMEKFITKQLGVLAESKEYIEDLLSLLNGEKYSHYRNYLKNPLLFSMVILTYLDKHSLPEEKHLFYSEVFDTFAYRHDSNSKPGKFDRKKILLTGLSRDKIQKILEIFSLLSYFENKYSFNKQEVIEYLTQTLDHLEYNVDAEDVLSDLQIGYCMLIEDSGMYSFPHRSLQEYFLASYIKNSSDEKEELYKELRDLDGPDTNLWSLLKEMDEVHFYKYYIIPLLSMFIKKMEGNRDDEKSIHVGYASYFSMKLISSGTYSIHVNLIFSLLKFLNLLPRTSPQLYSTNDPNFYGIFYDKMYIFADVFFSKDRDRIYFWNFKNKYEIFFHYLHDYSKKECLSNSPKLIDFYKQIQSDRDGFELSLEHAIKFYYHNIYVKELCASIYNWHNSIKEMIETLEKECVNNKKKKSILIRSLNKNKK